MSSNDPVLDTLLDEVITGRTPPDLSARIASRAQGVEVAEDEMSRSQAMAQVIKLHEHRADRWLRTGLVAAAAFIIGVGVFAWSPWSEDDDGIPISNTNLPYVADLGPGIIPGRAASFSKRNDMPQLDSGYALVKKGAKPIYAGGRKVSPRSGDALVWVGGQPQARDIGEMQDWVHANNNVNLSYDGLARLASPEGWNRQGDVSVCVLDGEVDYGPAKYTVIEKPLFRDADAMFQSLFTGLDRDGDGAINTNESALKSFAGLDRNGDGVLDLNEYSSNWTRVLKGNLGESGAFEFKYSTHATMNGRPMDGTVYEQSGEGDAAFDVLDKDGDGVLTADEAPWVDTMFKTYDKNCDGMVSRDEYAIVPGAKSAFRSSFHNEKRESSNSSSSSSDSSSSGSSSSGDMDQRVKEMMDEMKKRVDEEMGKAKQDGGTDA
ncbi:MAG: EF-hand domain-containing protein, partial [Planctomycetes bacterium]|nr:EF-hand domain-containing protein [Planctomycetota bacterium]